MVKTHHNNWSFRIHFQTTIGPLTISNIFSDLCFIQQKSSNKSKFQSSKICGFSHSFPISHPFPVVPGSAALGVLILQPNWRHCPNHLWPWWPGDEKAPGRDNLAEFWSSWMGFLGQKLEEPMVFQFDLNKNWNTMEKLWEHYGIYNLFCFIGQQGQRAAIMQMTKGS